MVEEGINKIKKLDNDGLIDPLSNFSSGNRAVYIISGKNDRTVPQAN